MDLVILTLATWQAVEIWHHSSLFAGWRSATQLWPCAGFWGWLRELLNCPWCTSVWVALALTAAWLYLEDWTRLPTYALAVSRLANVANDLTHAHCRSPRGLPQEETAHDDRNDSGDSRNPG